MSSVAQLRNFWQRLTLSKETQNIMNNLTLEVNDSAINEQVLLHIQKVSWTINVVFGVLVGASFVFIGLEYALVDAEFYDQGVHLIRSSFGLSYFVIWALLYYSKLRAYSHFSALLVPILCFAIELPIEYFWAENMKSYSAV